MLMGGLVWFYLWNMIVFKHKDSSLLVPVLLMPSSSAELTTLLQLPFTRTRGLFFFFFTFFYLLIISWWGFF